MGNIVCPTEWFGLISKIRRCHPELRLCQILSIAAFKAGWTGNDLFYCPDDTILNGLKLLVGEEN